MRKLYTNAMVLDSSDVIVIETFVEVDSDHEGEYGKDKAEKVATCIRTINSDDRTAVMYFEGRLGYEDMVRLGKSIASACVCMESFLEGDNNGKEEAQQDQAG